MKRFSLLIFTLLLSLNSFSQTGLDSTKIQLDKESAQIIAKALVSYQAKLQEVDQLHTKIDLLNDKINIQSQVTTKLDTQISNLTTTVDGKNRQLSLEREKSNKLQKEVMMSKIVTRIYKIGTYAGIILIPVVLFLK
jgi:TolA-binding protein